MCILVNKQIKPKQSQAASQYKIFSYKQCSLTDCHIFFTNSYRDKSNKIIQSQCCAKKKNNTQQNKQPTHKFLNEVFSLVNFIEFLCLGSIV